MAIRGSERAAKTIRLPKRLKNQPDRLPWPRSSEDEPHVPLGVDVREKKPDIIKLVHKFFWVSDVPMEELLQEVYLAILHKNLTRSAHDPRKSSFGHYVYMVANNVCINLVHRKTRYDKDRNSLDAPTATGSRVLLDTLEDTNQRPDVEETRIYSRQIEHMLRSHGMWDHARYCRAVMSGASPDVVREALSFGGRKMSNRMIRDIRAQIQCKVQELRLQI
jgi:hypothetical protein